MKRKIFFLITALSHFLILNAQFEGFKTPLFFNQHGVELYNQGTSQLKLGNFKEADSLLTLALCYYSDKDVYFNRAYAKLFLKDTINSCNDYWASYIIYYDKESSIQFNNYCCSKVDTLFYLKNLQLTNNAYYRYYEVIRKFKYENSIVGLVHDSKRKTKINVMTSGCNQNSTGLNTITMDIIGMYNVIDSLKYYRICTSNPNSSNPSGYDKIKEKAAVYLKSKYKDLKNLLNTDVITIYYEFQILENGNVEGCKLLKISPEISDSTYIIKLENDIKQIVSNYPLFEPAKFWEQNVIFIKSESVSF